MKIKSQIHKCGHFLLNDKCICCAELLHEWNFRLLDINFIDYELEDGPYEMALLDSDQHSECQWLKREYYLRISQSVENEEFENKWHQEIMRQRAEGKKIANIVKELKQKGKKIHRGTVRYVIRRFENKWGIREWSFKQMDLKPPPHTK